MWDHNLCININIDRYIYNRYIHKHSNNNLKTAAVALMQSESSSPSFFKKEVDVVITLIVDNGEFEGNMVFSQSELTYDDDVYLHELNGIRKK